MSSSSSSSSAAVGAVFSTALIGRWQAFESSIGGFLSGCSPSTVSTCGVSPTLGGESDGKSALSALCSLFGCFASFISSPSSSDCSSEASDPIQSASAGSALFSSTMISLSVYKHTFSSVYKQHSVYKHREEAQAAYCRRKLQRHLHLLRRQLRHVCNRSSQLLPSVF